MNEVAAMVHLVGPPHSLLRCCLVNDIIDSPQEYLDRNHKVRILILEPLPAIFTVLAVPCLLPESQLPFVFFC